MNRPSVIDASAFICWADREPGAHIVDTHLDRGAMISAVNLAETISKFVERGMDIPDIRRAVERSFLTIIPFDADLAWRAGLLRTTTRHLGLSLGDRACLALAEREGGVAVTCDRAWREVADVAVELVRP